MKRFQQDLPAVARQRATSRRCGVTRKADDLGRFRKRHALDCGNARCDACHSDKYPKRTLREHEVRADASLREQMRERSTLPDEGRNCAACGGWGWHERDDDLAPDCGWCGGTGRVEG